MGKLFLEQANALIEAALANGRERGLKPLGVAVVDAGGSLIAFQREDHSSTMRSQIAVGKACGALALGMSSRHIGELAIERPHLVSAFVGMAPGGLVPAAGGIILVDERGDPIGAMGVTGDTSDNDEACALAAAAAAGFRVQP